MLSFFWCLHFCDALSTARNVDWAIGAGFKQLLPLQQDIHDMTKKNRNQALRQPRYATLSLSFLQLHFDVSCSFLTSPHVSPKEPNEKVPPLTCPL